MLQPDRPVTVDVPATGRWSITGDLVPPRAGRRARWSHNALAYTEPDARLDLTARIEGERTIVVADTGPGLDAATAARVFDRFVRGEQSRSRRSGGAGLGSSIAKAIVEAHGGTITLETAPGTGCRFVVSLPRQAVAG